jgi:hypothetical protein
MGDNPYPSQRAGHDSWWAELPDWVKTLIKFTLGGVFVGLMYLLLYG